MGFKDLCVQELALCGVGEGTSVAVLTTGAGQQPAYATTFEAAASSLGATCWTVELNPHGQGSQGMSSGITPLAGNRAAVESLKQAEIIIDLMFLLFSPEQQEILESGTRILLCIEPVEVLARMMPTPDLRRRVEVGAELMGNATSLRFTNSFGTDVTYRIGELGILTEYGYTESPGRWDHWPAGFVAIAPDPGRVDGDVVLGPGDIAFPFRSYVEEPIHFHIEDGLVSEVTGGVGAELLADYMASFADPNAYRVSHIGWGLNENARWSGRLSDPDGFGMEGRSYYGNVLFSTGPDLAHGGTNRTACHLDIPMRGCSLFLDDEPIVLDGEVVVDDMRAASTRGR